MVPIVIEEDKKKMVKAVYGGSFDPMTLGHLDIIKRSMSFCDKLVVAIGTNPLKKTMFSLEEREKQIHSVLDKELEFLTSTNVSVESFDDLLVNFANKIEATLLIRGFRSVSDFEYEINLANINKTLAPNIDTVFLPTSPALGMVSSSAVKEIVKYGGDVSKFVPDYIAEQVKKQFGFVKYGE